mmetsp:Transcript_14011/g.33642  ORF Transcript_14011/g.33642 Transcript_14011/m.33642 type:complete len:132 (-) Transcript_14011:1030-1425(-)
MWLSSEIHRRSRMMKMKALMKMTALSIPMTILILDISLPAAEWQKAMYGFAKRHNIRKLKRLKLSHDLLYTYENMICFLIKLVLVPAKRLLMFTVLVKVLVLCFYRLVRPCTSIINCRHGIQDDANLTEHP